MKYYFTLIGLTTLSWSECEVFPIGSWVWSLLVGLFGKTMALLGAEPLLNKVCCWRQADIL